MSRRHAIMLEELGNVVRNHPVWPGNIASKVAADELAQLGLIKRGGERNAYWFPTQSGIRCHMAGSIAS